MGSKNIHWFLKTFQRPLKMFGGTKKYILILQNKENEKENKKKHGNEKLKI